MKPEQWQAAFDDLRVRGDSGLLADVEMFLAPDTVNKLRAAIAKAKGEGR